MSEHGLANNGNPAAVPDQRRASSDACMVGLRPELLQQCMLDAMPVAAYMCDAGGRLVGYNQRAVELWGRRPKLNDDAERFCGSLRLWTLDGQPIAHDECWMALALRHNESYHARQAVVERSDGTRRVALAHASPFCDDAGRICGAMNVLVDVTDSLRTADALRDSEARFAAFMRTMPLVAFMKDTAGRYVYVNHAWERTFERRAADCLGKTDHELWPPTTASQFLASDYRVLELGTTELVEETVEGPWGIEHWMVCKFPFRDAQGGLYLAGTALNISKQHQTEGELRRTSGLLQAVADGTTDAVFVKDLDGRYLFFNEAAARFVGRPVAQVLGKTDADIFEPQSAHVIREQDLRVIESGRVNTDEEELTAAGVTRIYLVTKAPYWDEQGNVAGIIGISRDISQRKQAERALRASEERLRALIAAVPDMIFRLDPHGVFVDCKVEPAEDLIAPPEVFLGKHFRDIMPPPISQHIAQHIELGRNTGQLQTFEYELPLPSGEVHWYEARLMVATDGHTLVVARDVTQWKRAEQNLQKTQQHLRAIIDAEPECVKLLDTHGRILEMNAAGLTMIGVDDPQQVIGKCAFDRIAPEHREAYVAMHQRVLSGAKETLEFDVIGLHGQRVSMETHAVPLTSNDNAQPLHLAISRDVTERKKLEEQFRQSQKMEAVGRLAGGVAHDFNNLLTVISGFSELLSMKLEPNSPLCASVQAIQDAAGRAAGLTRQLLAFSRKQVLAPTVLDLNDVVRSADEMLRRLIGENIMMSVELQPKIAPVTVDRGQIEQVIMNLVINARDTMPHGGRLTLATHCESSTGFVELAVSDTGHGMTDDIKARIFDPFFTTKELGKGTGLGLAVVHGIVSQSGGRVEVESQLGKGSTFRVLLPVTHSRTSPAAGESPCSEIAWGSETILLVEDDEAVRNFAALALSGFGYRVHAASDGAAAVALVERERLTPHLLLTDVVMPEMNGPVLADLLRRRIPNLKVLYSSGYADDAAMQHGLLQSGEAFLHKPYLPQLLARRVREVLDDRVALHPSL